MTRERAIEVLDRWSGFGAPDEEYSRVWYEANINDVEEAHDMAIAALRKQEELADLLEAKREGRLVVLPCKVGDKLYIVDGDEGGDWVDEYEVKYFYCSSRGINRIYSTCGTIAKNFRPKDIGKTVFLTREEAEKALKEDA